MLSKLTTLVGIASLLAACASPVAEVADSPDPTEGHAEIAWYEGTVDEAFAAAKAEGKPLFLYWGAVWCPPCHYLKNKIFNKPEFVEQSRSFVAVYLDGDTDRAQAWGEKLGAAGYPTVLVLSPDGEEVMRMSSDIPVEEYNRVLVAALSRMRPVKEVLEGVLAAGVENAEADDLRLLATYSWGQDRTVELTDEERYETFTSLYEGTSGELPVERSRFLAMALDEAASLADEEERSDPVLSEEAAAEYRAELLKLLADARQRASNVFFVAFSGPEVIDLLAPQAGASRDALVAAWEAAGSALEADETLSVTDRLYAINVMIELTRLRARVTTEGEEPAPLPDHVMEHLRSRIAWANEAVQDEGELQAVMNTMAGLLEDAELLEEAEQLIAARIDETVAPHYYMSWMSDLREQAGDTAGALDWSRQAWDRSEGPYTRFQWGSGYLRDAMRLAPDEIETIQSVSDAVLDELLTYDDAFANRNFSRLERLERSYLDWADDEARAAVVEKIRSKIEAHCERWEPSPDEASARQRCDAFLQVDEEAA